MTSSNIIITPEHVQRIKMCQALFSECLKRYKDQGTGASHDQIIKMSLMTLARNGFTQAEISEAMFEIKR